MPRAKQIVTKVPDEKGAQVCLQEYAHATSELKKIEAEMEIKIQKIREQYKGRIQPLKETQVDTFKLLQAFAEHNREMYFSKKKSKDMTHGLIGFRMGQMKVKFERGMSKKALPLVQEMDLPFTRSKVELDKDKIIASREDEGIMKKLLMCGITVVQDESFYVDLKEEEVVKA